MVFKSGRGGPRPGSGAKKLPWEQRTVKTSISIPRGIRAKLDEVADERGLSRAKVILEAIEAYLGVTTKDLSAEPDL